MLPFQGSCSRSAPTRPPVAVRDDARPAFTVPACLPFCPGLPAACACVQVRGMPAYRWLAQGLQKNYYYATADAAQVTGAACRLGPVPRGAATWACLCSLTEPPTLTLPHLPDAPDTTDAGTTPTSICAAPLPPRPAAAA